MPINFRERAPTTYEEALAIVTGDLNDDEIRTMMITESSVFHHDVGRDMRNEWKLWFTKTPLVQHFAARWGITHADDISGLILEAAFAFVRGTPFNVQASVDRYLEHWKLN